jgi:hypothetical protein
MSTGLGALFQGVQSGIETRDISDLRHRQKEYLKLRNTGDRTVLEGLNETLAGAAQMEGIDYTPFEIPELRDTPLERFGGFLKERFGFGSAPAESSTSGIQDTSGEQMSAVDNPQQLWRKRDGGPIYTDKAIPSGRSHYLRHYQDGGGVPPLFDKQGNRRQLTDEERRHRSYGDYYVTESEAESNRAARSRGEHRNRNPLGGRYKSGVDRQGISDDLSGGGLGEFGSDLARAASETDTAQSLRNLNEVAGASVRNIQDAGDARSTGRAVRASVQDAGAGALNIAGGIASDFGIDKLKEFGAGFLGFDGQEGVPANPSVGKSGTKGGEKAAAVASVDTPDQSDEEIAQQAISTGEKTAAENFDYRYLPEDTRPEDLPSMSTKEWADGRKQMVMGLIKQGKDPSEAYKIVDDITVDRQMRGMERELTKAITYAGMGDLRAAGFAIRQGFQYFPNGVDVKLAIQNDAKTGTSNLVAFGVDEETGEPTGQPMVITADRLAALRENFSNPAAFRTWTKDGLDLQLEIAKLKDISAYRQGTLGIQEANAITDRLEAETEARTGGQGGRKYSDLDRGATEAVKEFKEMEFNGILPEGVATSLGSTAEELIRLGYGPRETVAGLRDAWNGEPGGEAGVLEYLRSRQRR